MNLQQLHSDFCALQQQKVDVDERYAAKLAELKAQIQQLEKAWGEANAELVNERQHVGDEAAACERTLRAEIVAAYLANPESKTVAPKLSVRVAVKPVYDKERALAWAKEHGLALALDAKVFEKIASVQPLDFVTTEESITAVIAK